MSPGYFLNRRQKSAVRAIEMPTRSGRRPRPRVYINLRIRREPSQSLHTRHNVQTDYLQLLRDVADEDELWASALQQTLKTTFMLWLVHRPPMRL